MTLTDDQAQVLRALRPGADGSRGMLYLAKGKRIAEVVPGPLTVPYVVAAHLIHQDFIGGAGPWFGITPTGLFALAEHEAGR